MRVSYAIVFVSDMARSVAFYRDVLGIAVKFETSHWTELATEGATLALHAVEPGEPAGGREQAGSCRPGLAVADLDAYHARMLAHGVPCLQEPKVVFGSRIAQYADPDGLPISVSDQGASSG